MGASLTLVVHYDFSRWMLAMREAQIERGGRGREPGREQMGKVRNRSSAAADRWRAGDAKGKEHEKERRSASVIDERYWAMLHRCGCGYWIRYVSGTRIHTFPKTPIREYG
jgi:hypothetical protein